MKSHLQSADYHAYFRKLPPSAQQKVEAALYKEFPQAKVLRMDMDTTKRKNSHEQILSAFSDGEADILVGTQMIVKGHDFANVTLVGVLAADLSLHANRLPGRRKNIPVIDTGCGKSRKRRQTRRSSDPDIFPRTLQYPDCS